ncbi:hypothetical protein KCU95_g10550, partial [Aureobasidium melanogenum]
MALQQSPQYRRYRVNTHAQAQYDRLYEKHGLSPTADDVAAIKGVIGPVNTRSTIGGQFEAGLLFFLPKSNVRFEQGALLIGWVLEKHKPKLEVWFKITAGDKRGLYHLPAGSPGSRYYPGGEICHEWHPNILDIVGWDKDALRLLQYAYLRSCIKILQAPVPPPSIEDSRPTINNSTPTDSNMVDLTYSDEEGDIKPETTPISTGDTQLLDVTVEERVQAFREKLEKREVNELQQMLEKQSELPTWIMDLAKAVLRRKMLKELELAESLLL